MHWLRLLQPLHQSEIPACGAGPLVRLHNSAFAQEVGGRPAQ
jgi:hypothetical protein